VPAGAVGCARGGITNRKMGRAQRSPGHEALRLTPPAGWRRPGTNRSGP